MSDTTLKRLEEESKEFYQEHSQGVLEGKFTVRDILGIKLPKARVFVPDSCSVGITSFYSLLPLYDTIIFPIFSHMKSAPPVGEAIDSIDKFQEIHKATPEQLANIADKGRFLPYLISPYTRYDSKIIEPFLEPGIPFLTKEQMELLFKFGLCKFVNHDCEKCGERIRKAAQEFSDEKEKGCGQCLSIFYQYGYDKEKVIMKRPSDNNVTFRPKLCYIKNVIISRNIDSVYSTQCHIGKDALGVLSNVQDPEIIEYVCKGLKINYTEDIPLSTYLDLLDNKTTKAIRKTVGNIMRDPLSMKYRQHLNAKIYEYNQDIENFSNSRAARFYQAVADLTVYGGTKLIEDQTQKYVKVDDKKKSSLSKTLASTAMDIHATITGKDWTLAQLYKFRCGLNSCKDTQC